MPLRLRQHHVFRQGHRRVFGVLHGAQGQQQKRRVFPCSLNCAARSAASRWDEPSLLQVAKAIGDITQRPIQGLGHSFAQILQYQHRKLRLVFDAIYFANIECKLFCLRHETHLKRKLRRWSTMLRQACQHPIEWYFWKSRPPTPRKSARRSVDINIPAGGSPMPIQRPQR